MSQPLPYDEIRNDRNIKLDVILNLVEIQHKTILLFCPVNLISPEDNFSKHMKQIKHYDYTQTKNLVCDWIQLAESDIEHKEPVIVDCFVLQYAKLRMLELYYNFSQNFAIRTNLRRWKWIPIHFIHYKKKKSCMIEYEVGESKSRNYCAAKTSTVRSLQAFAAIVRRTCCAQHKKHNEREPRLFKEDFRCTETFSLCNRKYSSYDSLSNKIKFSSKD